MRKLNVFVISGEGIETLPPSLHLRTQLRTLYLHSCSVKNISPIGQLENLEILSCYDCPRIEVLPTDIWRLNRLKLLELYECQNLKTIAPGVISSLILLEELKMRGSFSQWERSGSTNAALTELQSLSHLVCLEIEVEDPEVITTWIDHFPNVTEFYIKIGAKVKTEVQHPCKTKESQQCIQLSLPDTIFPGYWFHSLLRRTGELSFTGNGSINLVSENFEKVTKFRCCYCSAMTILIDSSNQGTFCILESLHLEGLTKLKDICVGPIPVGSFMNLQNLKLYEMPSLLHLWINPHPYSSLANLKSIDIRNCKLLPHLFTLSTVGSFNQLEELRILYCGRMKEVLLEDLHKTTVSIAFPRLKKLILNSLPSLEVFCQGITSMNFPLLHFLSIRNVPKLKGLLPKKDYWHIFFNQGVEFESLKDMSLHGLDDTINQIWPLSVPTDHFSALEKLHIGACNKLKYLFTPMIAIALVSLKELHIQDSLMLFEVIIRHETEATLFPSLERISLSRLRSVRSFCRSEQESELPSLRHLSICMCPELQSFTLGYLSTPKLECFEVENEQLVEFDDLNGALRQHFRSKTALKGSSSAAAGRR